MNEQSLKEKLKNVAKEKNLSFYDVWHQFLLERVLVRLSRSQYSNEFIFKGGLLLARYIKIGRETRDIDLLAYSLKIEEKNITKAFKHISAIYTNDKFRFSFYNISQHNETHMNYPRFRVKLNATFGNMKGQVQIDIASGDIVKPRQKSFESFTRYSGKAIFEENISLKVYPVETIFAEKLETIISIGEINSRMRDYHDLVLLCRENNLFEPKKLKESILSTFQHRGTQSIFPIDFSPEAYSMLQIHWKTHIKKQGKMAREFNLPFNIQRVINEINAFLIDKNICE